MWFSNYFCCVLFFLFFESNPVHPSSSGDSQVYWRRRWADPNSGVTPSEAYRRGSSNRSDAGRSYQLRQPPPDFNAGIKYQGGRTSAGSNSGVNDEEHTFTSDSNYTVKSYQCGKNIRVTKLTTPSRISSGPFWDTVSRSVYFTDFLKSTVRRYEIDTKSEYSAKLGHEYLTDVIPVKGAPDTFLVAYGDYLAVLTWNGVSKEASLRPLRLPDPNHSWPDFFLTSLKVAPNGALFFHSRPRGILTVAQHRQATVLNVINGNQKTLITGINVGSGAGFSQNGEWFYHSDSFLNTTYKSYYDQRTNSIASMDVLVNLREKGFPGRTRGVTVDKDGYVWIATSHGNGVLKVNPKNGDVVCSVQVPAVGPTDLTFGECPNVKNGKLNCLYVTTHRINMTSPTAFDGTLLVVEGTGSEGVLPNKLTLNGILDRELIM